MSTQHQYPRPLHPGGFALPPLVEDRLHIMTTTTTTKSSEDDGTTTLLQTDVMLIKPPDMESLFEWYCYTKNNPNCDPSWGRVWPTSLSLARMIIRSLNGSDETNTLSAVISDEDDEEKKKELLKQAVHALQTASHAIELGCGLGVAGLTYATTLASSNKSHNKRTITFLDREPYALHCVLSSASTNGIATGPIIEPAPVVEDKTNKDDDVPVVTARAAMDDWTLPMTIDESNDKSPIKNMCYQDLHLNTLACYENQNTILLASDILYEPSSMKSLAIKLQSLLNPTNGGYALIADPEKERTPGCREAFVNSVQELGGSIGIYDMPSLEQNNVGVGGGRGPLKNNQQVILLEGDVDIDGQSLAKTVLVVVSF